MHISTSVFLLAFCRPPAFANRPWSCEQCCRFFHIGCLGASHVEDLPAKPWFHAHSCRRERVVEQQLLCNLASKLVREGVLDFWQRQAKANFQS
eukprot:scaffold251577_cov17-Tisochrysis_lutea.AAC.2